jgi:MinD superfamily P-loop ATPase
VQGISGPFTIAVASGKGGTGKTMVATNLAAWAARLGHRVALADCDVDAPDDHLFLGATMVWHPITPLRPQIDTERCWLQSRDPACTRCRDACHLGAIRILGHRTVLFPDSCKGCGACVNACLAGAITEVPEQVGKVGVAHVERGPAVVSGFLDIGKTEAPTVVRATRTAAQEEGAEVVVIDAPPGVACQVVASVRDVDLLLLVVDPTEFGLHDLKLVIRLGRELELPMAAVINRDGSGTADIQGTCDAEGIPVITRIPFERSYAEVCAAGRLVVEHHPDGPVVFDRLWRGVAELATSIRGAIPA